MKIEDYSKILQNDAVTHLNSVLKKLYSVEIEGGIILEEESNEMYYSQLAEEGQK